jgi:recombination protein RecR
LKDFAPSEGENPSLDPRPARAGALGRRREPTDPADTLGGLFAAPVNRLITELARLPGIGQRTAQRLAFHLLSASEEEALALADAIREVKQTVGHCEICFNLATETTCRICQDERREEATICVVEQPSDVIPIERSGEFHGRYHVLGGALSPIDGVDPEDLHIAELLRRVEPNGSHDNGAVVREVVIATNATTTGEATALYLADSLHERAPEVAVTRLASGLPVGSDLEYADEITLGRALRGRQAL